MKLSTESLTSFSVAPVIVVCLCASWGTYILLAPGLTPVTTPILVSIASLPIIFGLYVRKVNLGFIDLLPALLLFGVFCSSIWSLIPSTWTAQAYWYTICIGFYYYTRVCFNRASSLKLTAQAAVIGGLIGMSMIATSVNEWGIVDSRKSIAGVNQNFTAYVFAGTIFLVYSCIKFFKVSRITALLGLFSCFILALGIFSLGTRGAIISLILMSIWYVMPTSLTARLSTALLISSLIIAMASTFGLLENIAPYIESLFQRDTGDLSGRLPTWEYARHLIGDNLFTGIGAGVFQAFNPMRIGAHNIFLVTLLDTGLLGFLTYLTFLIGGLAPGLRLSASGEQRSIVGLFCLFFFPIALSGHVELSPFMWLLFGFTFTLVRFGPNRVPHG